ncbi:MAG: hypothetical protein AAGC88_08055, partial [Bacteroidota bacterium]
IGCFSDVLISSSNTGTSSAMGAKVCLGNIADLKDAKVEHLHIISDRVVEMIKKGEAGWEEMVPSRVSKSIKSHSMFGYKPRIGIDID